MATHAKTLNGAASPRAGGRILPAVFFLIATLIIGPVHGEGSPRAVDAVADFYLGLLGDDERFDRAADWPRFCEKSSVRAAGDKITPEVRAHFRDDASVRRFKQVIRDSSGELEEATVRLLISKLKEVDGGGQGQVLIEQPGGGRWVVEQGADGWKIVDLLQ